jgi:hypothetical protein
VTLARKIDAARHRVMVSPDSFLGSLSFQELQFLRRYVRAKHMEGWPAVLKTDREADRMIEAYGPAVKEAVLKKAVEAKWGRS